ncbi:MAG: cache domain-containing protein [Chloroflexi bacterium]|nr:cache domain-containing protein [Chloroflexota bacterium]
MRLIRRLLVAVLVLSFSSACGEEATVDDPAAYTQMFVQRAVDMYTAVGRNATVAYYNDPASMKESWYVFIIDRDGVIVAHAARPERRGLTLGDLVDVRGYEYGGQFAAVPEGEGRWVSYRRVNPTTNQQEKKHSWVRRVDGLLIGSGWYESPSTT